MVVFVGVLDLLSLFLNSHLETFATIGGMRSVILDEIIQPYT